MRRRNWRGTTLFLSIFAILGATLGLKFYSSAAQPALTSSLSSGTTGADTASAPSAAPSASPSASPSGAASAAPTQGTTTASTATQTVNGDAVQTRFGTVQVAVTFSGTTITKLNVLQAPQESGHDMELTNYSVPVLTQEVLSSQSANVDTVSGATYTSEGYLQSVQSAIDKLG
jgi:uncharacterized protein with FMN-binding domain